MTISETYLRDIMIDLAMENPLGCGGLLSVAGVVFSASVPTLAVTCEDRVLLVVNRSFIEKHCDSELDVKCLLLHEYLHVLLGHTLLNGVTFAMNITFDAVINALIYRLDAQYSSFMQRYYAGATGVLRLLRPPTEQDKQVWFILPRGEFYGFWKELYSDAIGIDEVYDFVCMNLGSQCRTMCDDSETVLGNHRKPVVPDRIFDLDEYLRQEREHRVGKQAGVGGRGEAYDKVGVDPRRSDWVQSVNKALRASVTDGNGRALMRSWDDARLPLLNASDRRGFLQSLWNPLIPDIAWAMERPVPSGSVSVYLDVSGSMCDEINALLGLLKQYHTWIRQPMWAFSTNVTRAEFKDGRLQTISTGGTDIDPVIKHIATTGPEKAIIVTDGGFSAASSENMHRARRTEIHVLLSQHSRHQTLKEMRVTVHELGTFVGERRT